MSELERAERYLDLKKEFIAKQVCKYLLNGSIRTVHRLKLCSSSFSVMSVPSKRMTAPLVY